MFFQFLTFFLAVNKFFLWRRNEELDYDKDLLVPNKFQNIYIGSRKKEEGTNLSETSGRSPAGFGEKKQNYIPMIVVMPKHNSQYNLKLIETVYSHVPAFTDIFDEESWYIFVSCFVALTVLVFFILSRFVKLKPVDWWNHFSFIYANFMTNKFIYFAAKSLTPRYSVYTVYFVHVRDFVTKIKTKTWTFGALLVVQPHRYWWPRKWRTCLKNITRSSWKMTFTFLVWQFYAGKKHCDYRCF